MSIKLNKCFKCGDTFYSQAEYDAHIVPTTDGRVKIEPLGDRPGEYKRKWLMAHEGMGGSGWVTTKPLPTMCTRTLVNKPLDRLLNYVV